MTCRALHVAMDDGQALGETVTKKLKTNAL